MLLVKTILGPSAIHGMGLYAAEDIPAGTEVWRFQKNFDQSLSPETIAAFPETARAYMKHFGYPQAGTPNLGLDSDDARFINHADQPNLESRKLDSLFARRPIRKDEEITMNYRDFLGPDATIRDL